ncbi:MAG: sulfurtransferase TusA family protein [Candidatus Hodarchaeales archaeon]|jgi:tRNA 2-thiouridine synthesizing protein A
MSVEIAQTFDAKGLSCPMPVIKSKKALKELELGQVLEVLATDPGSVNDFAAWTRTTGQELLESSEQDGVYRFLVRRKK